VSGLSGVGVHAGSVAGSSSFGHNRAKMIHGAWLLTGNLAFSNKK
jgi:hypothetical protein